ncbi:MAG TPA: succinylglutamate desuccinylase [Candidatus Saccharicenans sp.]|nr:succinylglutamate desuccinylase [Candidatus Saccharicenans sp.]HOT68870.1 succinylglutamate desuccinylase [Candidatus Saccharicenans sp.]HPC87546.1 succinylglutamate desuccinylase [Candidatus Saccharicenans sp.]HPP23864.1 succinylglutamate desuccinylase [Candidatus Saccharicenans sp.]HQH60967.1 succinylglutamate desuccinylase [Candidatus Saccharicenans sp.]
MNSTDKQRKWLFGMIFLVIFILAGISFYRSRHLPEPVVLGEGVTEVKKLSDYFPGIKGSINDATIYILGQEGEGGSVLILGGSHPEEPAGRLAAWIIIENARVKTGRIFVIPTANPSASTSTRPGGAYPPDYSIKTSWGEQKFRQGDRWSNPLDQWPDPEVYIHYPSKQQLAYMDIRNQNRTWPGRPDGLMTEKTCYGMTQLIRQEKIDLVIDLHEAELQYPVISTIVVHPKGQDLAALASMTISAEEGFDIGVEYSPEALRGLSHREIGDWTDAIPLLMETPEPFLDATRGKTDRNLLLTGRDEFVMKAGKHGLLFEKLDERGWPIDVRVGRHLSSIAVILKTWSELRPDRLIEAEEIPRYSEIVEKTTGFYLKNPAEAPANRLSFE